MRAWRSAAGRRAAMNRGALVRGVVHRLLPAAALTSIRRLLLAARIVLLLRNNLLLLHLKIPAVRAALLLLLLEHLIVQALTVVLHGELCVVIDGDADGAVAVKLILWIVELHDVRVAKRLLGRNALCRVELEAETNQVQGLDASRGEHLIQRPCPAHRQRLQHRGRKGRLDGVDVFWSRTACDLHDAIQLVHCRCSWEDGLPGEELPQNAAHTPQVNALRVRSRAEQDLRRTVPARGHIVRQHWILCVVLLLHNTPGQSEVADLHLAVGVEQNVRRLDVAVQHLSRMHELERLEELIDDVLLVNLLQDVGTDYRMQIRLHVVADEVNVLIIVGLEHIQQPYDVFVAVEFLQEHDLAESSLRIGGVLEGVEALLQGNNLASLFVDGFPDDTVSSASKLLNDLVLSEHVPVDFLAHGYPCKAPRKRRCTGPRSRTSTAALPLLT
mmetsp:Transcript_35640/g.57417  ORF Transcript_35640/g.57417 Transcript_35640/m.57417 type:complete len:443 (+) Transcript_35640:359-1687(+)